MKFQENSESIYRDLPEIIQKSVNVLAITHTLTEPIAERLLKSFEIANGNAQEVVLNLKKFPIWVKRNQEAWAIDDSIREVAINNLNGKSLQTKRKTVEILREFEPELKSKGYQEFKDYQLQIARLSLNIPEKQEESISKIRSFFNAAEAFNNHEGSRVLSSYIDESFSDPDISQAPTSHLLSAFFIKALHLYRKRDYETSLKYLIPIIQYHQNSYESIKDAAISAHLAGVIYTKQKDQPSTAESFFLKSIELEKINNRLHGLAQVYHSLGNLYSKENSRHKEAESAYKESLNIRIPLKDNYGLIQVYHSLGNLYSKNKRKFEAEEAYQKSLRLLSKTSDPYSSGQVYHSLGNLYSKNRYNLKEAESLFIKSLSFRKTANDKLGLAQTYHSLGILYSNDDSRLKEAEEAYLESLKIEKENNNKYGVAIVYNVLGNLYRKNKNRLKEAEEAYLLGIEIGKEINNKRLLTISYVSLGKLMVQMGDYIRAKELFNTSLKYERDPNRIRQINSLIRSML